MSGKGWIFAVAFLGMHLFLPAQGDPRQELDPSRLIEEAFPAQELDLNYSDLYENLLQRLSHPLDLNNATEEDLRSLLILREVQLVALIQYRTSLGPFVSIYELQAIAELDPATIRRLKLVVRVNDRSTAVDKDFVDRVRHGNGYFLMRNERTLQLKNGYRKDIDPHLRYAGSPDKMYARLRSNRPGDYSFGLTVEKDAGEAILWNPKHRYYGADFITAHLQLINKGRLKNLIVGDFQAQFGQGLVLGGGFGIGKGAETITTLRKSNLGFTPYLSVNESGFFHGAAVSCALSPHWTLHAMASVLHRDANSNQDSTDASLVSSFVLTGYHRTPAEIANRKVIGEMNAASVLEFRNTYLNAGVLIHSTNFSLPLIRTPTLYNQFAFQGDHNLNVGGFLNASAGNFAFFSEAAQTVHKGQGIVLGILGSATRELDISLLYRTYARNFISLYGNALSENSTPQNEQALYWGLKFSPVKKLTASAYIDVFRFPWLRYRDYAPSQGREWLVRLALQPSKSFFAFLQVREEVKSRNLADPSNLYRPGEGTKRNYWIHSEYTFLNRLTFRTRIQFSTYSINGHTSGGMLVLQDVSLRAGPFVFSGRYALFDTDDYDNRLYAYERDVWLAVSFPAYYGKGLRNLLMVEYRLTRRLTLWVRWAHTRYRDRQTIGTSGETIQGNTQDDVKLQLSIKF